MKLTQAGPDIDARVVKALEWDGPGLPPPFSTHEVAVVVLDRFPKWEIGKDWDGQHWCALWLGGPGGAHRGAGPTAPLAICAAILQALEERL